MSRDELLDAWVAEAKHVLKAQEDLKDGLCVWKSVGKREVRFSWFTFDFILKLCCSKSIMIL